MQNYTLFHKDISLTVEQGELLGSFQLRPTPKGAEHRMINREISRLVPTLEVQKLEYPELAEDETLDLEALYASVDWSKPVELPLSLYSQFKQAQSVETGMGVIYAQEEAQEYVPQYKTHMTSDEFTRDVLTKAEWAAIETHTQTNADVAVWRNITIAGEVWTEHPEFQGGMQMGIQLGIWSEERAVEISKGLLIG